MKAIPCEVFKSINELNSKFVYEMFNINQMWYDLRNETILVQPKYKNMIYGYKTYTYFGLHLWNTLPSNVIGDISFNTIKTLINKMDGPNCNWSLCTMYIFTCTNVIMTC